MFSSFLQKIKYKLLLSQMKPEILGYYDAAGKNIPLTRVSNMSHLSNKKNLNIGNNVFIGHFNYLDGLLPVTLAEGVQITNYVSILTHSSHNAIRLYGQSYAAKQNAEMPGLRTGTVSIGEYTFIGPHSVIMPGTVLGKGCIVGAYSMVSGTFADYSVIKGNPAVVVGDTRQTDEAFLQEHPELRAYYWEKSNRG